MPRVASEYAVYQGDAFLDIGTVAELAERFGVTQETIRFWATPAHLNRTKKSDGQLGDRRIVIKLDEEDE